MKAELREQALRLRLEKHLSYGAIRKQVPVAKSTLSYWLREFPLTEEEILELRREGWKKSEASRERYRNTRREQREEKDRQEYKKYLEMFSHASPDTFFVSGLMLYLGEGAKTNNYTICVANTNPKILVFFTKWLCTFFRVPKETLRAYLHLYENMDIAKEKKFWKDTLGFGENQFYKPYISENKKASFTYRESFRHGTCSVTYTNTVIKRKIKMAIQAYTDSVLSSYSHKKYMGV